MSENKPIIFLFGAGASYGAGGILPETPPLGLQLYEILEEIYPGSWGALPEKYKGELKKDFEKGMGMVYDDFGSFIPRLMREMAIYFIQFMPYENRCLYSKLLTSLKKNSQLDNVLFSTLNYECVLEYSIVNVGFNIDYFEKTKDSIPVWKLHGSCNMFSQGVQAGQGVSYGTGVVFEGGIEAFLDKNKIIEECLVKSGLAPVMCLFMKGKPLQVSPSSIEKLQEKWANEILNAKAVFSVGVNPLPADTHIWDPLSQTDADLFYIGDEENFNEWVSEYRENHSEFLSPYFHKGFNQLINKLKLI